MSDTIYALSSGPGTAGVAVIRLSGPAAGEALKSLTGRPLPTARHASVRRLAEPDTGEQLDDALVLWFPAPASYSGEDMVEIQVHGGRAVIACVLDALGTRPGLRLAEPGEFTRRAFDNGRLDLTAAEGIADLVAAETAAQRRQALRQIGGALETLYEGWRGRLIGMLAHLEAELEFPDEDLPGGVSKSALADLAVLRTEIVRHLADGRRGEGLREGIAIAILGAPNAGKSSLLNRLARRDAAIVAETAGTTRDVIEVRMDLAGYPVVLADTAGLREAAGDAVEAEGIRRALARAAAADLRITVFDATLWPSLDATTLDLVDDRAIVVLSKCDLRTREDTQTVRGRPVHAVSAVTGGGIDQLLTAVIAMVEDRFAAREAPVLTRARHRDALSECVSCLDRAEAAQLPELAAEDVRLAARALSRITGRVDVENILDAIFRDFCIGK